MNEIWVPTDDELELLSTSDQDILKKHEAFSFDCENFSERVKVGDNWQQLVQSHLYFEHVVTQILSEALANPEAISLSRMGFSQRLDLIVAMALLPDELVVPIRKISGLRNKLAHNLSFRVSERDVRNLENCTPTHLRDAVRAEEGRANDPLALHELIEVILLKADIIRQRHAASREIGKKAELRLKAVLRKTPNVKYVP